MDNVMIERLWRSLKYESVYRREMETNRELRQELSSWFEFYNNHRPHKAFGGMKPMEVYQQNLNPDGVPPLDCIPDAA